MVDQLPGGVFAEGFGERQIGGDEDEIDAVLIDGKTIKQTAGAASTELGAAGFDAMGGALKVM